MRNATDLVGWENWSKLHYTDFGWFLNNPKQVPKKKKNHQAPIFPTPHKLCWPELVKIGEKKKKISQAVPYTSDCV